MRQVRQFLAAVAIALVAAVPAAADDAVALAAVKGWVGAVVSGSPDEIGAVLAPEFQIVRSDGSAHDKADYLAGGFARITDVVEIDDLHVTGAGDLMVVRYVLVISGSVDGKALKARAPRLTVFRRDGDKWLVVAHANFAAVGK